jgi:hypothetical protein
LRRAKEEVSVERGRRIDDRNYQLGGCSRLRLRISTDWRQDKQGRQGGHLSRDAPKDHKQPPMRRMRGEHDSCPDRSPETG